MTQTDIVEGSASLLCNILESHIPKRESARGRPLCRKHITTQICPVCGEWVGRQWAGKGSPCLQIRLDTVLSSYHLGRSHHTGTCRLTPDRRICRGRMGAKHSHRYRFHISYQYNPVCTHNCNPSGPGCLCTLPHSGNAARAERTWTDSDCRRRKHSKPPEG